MTNKLLVEAYHQCLAELEAGVELEVVLARFPDLASELRDALGTSQDLRALAPDEVPLDSQKQSQTKTLAYATELRDRKRKSALASPLRIRWAFAILLALILSFTWNEIAVVSAHALPGDRLYTLKRVLEELKLGLAFDIQEHLQIESQFQERRVAEIEKLFDEARIESVEFYDTVNSQNAQEWVVGGIPVKILPGTQIIGDISVGMVVEVEGYTDSDGFIQAVEIHLDRFDISGFVEEVGPTNWVIDGQQIYVRRDTVLLSDISVGDQVLVQIRADDAGQLTAEIIQLASLPAAVEDVLWTFSGRVQAVFDDSLLVAGRLVTLDDNTVLDDDIHANDRVQVDTKISSDGLLIARQILVLQHATPDVESENLGESEEAEQYENETEDTPVYADEDSDDAQKKEHDDDTVDGNRYDAGESAEDAKKGDDDASVEGDQVDAEDGDGEGEGDVEDNSQGCSVVDDSVIGSQTCGSEDEPEENREVEEKQNNSSDENDESDEDEESDEEDESDD
jgi:hypothetical protein